MFSGKPVSVCPKALSPTFVPASTVPVASFVPVLSDRPGWFLDRSCV